MRVLIGCEFSGIVREAFRAKGHDAWSCDLLPTEIQSKYHYQEDIFNLTGFFPRKTRWDLLIAHPPCTYLTNAGSRHLYIGGRKENGLDPERWSNMQDAVSFFNRLLRCSILKICVENPIMHIHARELIREPYAQIIQPFEHGHAETKATCLWLKNLPKLKPTKFIPPDFVKYPKGKGSGYEPRVHHASPGPSRWMERSRTLPGIAKAMAEAWG